MGSYESCLESTLIMWPTADGVKTSSLSLAWSLRNWVILDSKIWESSCDRWSVRHVALQSLRQDRLRVCLKIETYMSDSQSRIDRRSCWLSHLHECFVNLGIRARVNLKVNWCTIPKITKAFVTWTTMASKKKKRMMPRLSCVTAYNSRNKTQAPDHFLSNGWTGAES